MVKSCSTSPTVEQYAIDGFHVSSHVSSPSKRPKRLVSELSMARTAKPRCWHLAKAQPCEITASKSWEPKKWRIHGALTWFNHILVTHVNGYLSGNQWGFHS